MPTTVTAKLESLFRRSGIALQEARQIDKRSRALRDRGRLNGGNCDARQLGIEEALTEVDLDLQQGADLVMVKPAGAYLDVIRAVRERVNVPVVAYQVSGEYSMLEAAAKNGWIDRERAVLESLIAIKRAGADLIITYYAELLAKLLKE